MFGCDLRWNRAEKGQPWGRACSVRASSCRCGGRGDITGGRTARRRRAGWRPRPLLRPTFDPPPPGARRLLYRGPKHPGRVGQWQPLARSAPQASARSVHCVAQSDPRPDRAQSSVGESSTRAATYGPCGRERPMPQPRSRSRPVQYGRFGGSRTGLFDPNRGVSTPPVPTD